MMKPLVFRTVWRNEEHHWLRDGEKINDDQKLVILRQVLDESGPVIMEHRFYCGSSAPERLIFDDFDELVDYLRQYAKAGDSIWVWNLDGLLREDNALVHGKCPAEDGSIPRGGAY
jgi:hypothetical protein